MIKDYHIVASTFVTNTELTGYYPVTKACLESMSNTDFVDEVLLCDGQSIDYTVLLHSDIPKVKIIQGPFWDINSWSWDNVLGLENTLLNYVSNHDNKQVISLLFSADTVWTDDFREELFKNLNTLIDKKEKNYLSLPFQKTINRNLKTKIYDALPHFFVVGALKFNPSIRWLSYQDEIRITGYQELNRLDIKFNASPLSYDMFMFTRENINHKLSRYKMINDQLQKNPTLLDPDEYIKNVWLKKALSLSPENIVSHPKEADQFLKNLSQKNFGFDCLGHLKNKI